MPLFPWQEGFIMTINFMKTCAGKPRPNLFLTPSKIPPDVRLRVERLSVAMETDPFEAALMRNVNLMRDEFNESGKRSKIAHEMLKEVVKARGQGGQGSRIRG